MFIHVITPVSVVCEEREFTCVRPCCLSCVHLKTGVALYIQETFFFNSINLLTSVLDVVPLKGHLFRL